MDGSAAGAVSAGDHRVGFLGSGPHGAKEASRPGVVVVEDSIRYCRNWLFLG